MTCSRTLVQVQYVPAVIFGCDGGRGEVAARSVGCADGAAGPGPVVHQRKCCGLSWVVRCRGNGCRAQGAKLRTGPGTSANALVSATIEHCRRMKMAQDTSEGTDAPEPTHRLDEVSDAYIRLMRPSVHTAD